MKIWEKFYECECGSEVVAISKDRDDEEDPCIYMSFFKQGFRGIYALTWKERLRAIWTIITKGTLWADNIILSPKEAKNLAQGLLEFSEKENSK